ncbi:MAG: ABC-type transport auxiliary lipoprotein family protein [Myxococcota bacterium]|nr:ABC-type transport auxiliary lipoprotein family protein [Myxococcota bacterium]
MNPRRRVLAAAVLTLAAAGCVAGPAPRDHFYRLDIPKPAKGSPALPGVLEVERFRSDDVLRRSAMVRSAPGSSEVRPYTYHLWVNSPTLVLQRALADYLRAAGVAQTVTTPDAGMTEDWQVTGNLRHFDHITGDAPAALVAIELRLRRYQSARAVLQKVYRAQVPADGGSPQAAADAFSAAVTQVFQEFTTDLRAVAP